VPTLKPSEHCTARDGVEAAALGHDEQLHGIVEPVELGLPTASHVARLPGPRRRTR
jgi:hypothetical protein